MSRFFRHSLDSSSSDESEDETKETLVNSSSRPSSADASLSSTNAVVQTTAASLPDENTQRDILLHALLEERCLRQTHAELESTRSADTITAIATRRYRYMSQQLSRFGLLTSTFDSHEHSSTRRQVRDGLDTLISGYSDSVLTSSDLRVADSMRELQRLSSNLSNMQLANRVIERPLLMFDQGALAHSPGNLQVSLRDRPQDLLIDTRYQRDFEEIALLGRGGFGVVHHCKHRWDGLSYAIKRIPLSSSRLRNIQQRGQAEVDDMLLELKTLARLDHPNVVRYFSGWIELSTFNDGAQSSSPVSASTLTGGQVSSEHVSITSGTSFTHGHSSDFITFGYSRSASRRSVVSGASETSQGSGSSIHRVDTRATVSDDAESISREDVQEVELSTLSTHVRESATCLALHIQMGLYPLTLADVLIDQASNTSRHCFHIEPAGRLLSALVDGVAYLHDQGVIHRDLKPANIFLAASPSIGTTACRRCHAQNLDSTAYKLRIGDFGLVTAVAQHDVGSDMSPVGTEIYHPSQPHRGLGVRSLDWYAVGMIAFELIWPFSTRMERYETLRALKAGVYPPGFAQRFGPAADQITELLEHLLRPLKAINVDRVRRMLGMIYSN